MTISTREAIDRDLHWSITTDWDGVFDVRSVGLVVLRLRRQFGDRTVDVAISRVADGAVTLTDKFTSQTIDRVVMRRDDPNCYFRVQTEAGVWEWFVSDVIALPVPVTFNFCGDEFSVSGVTGTGEHILLAISPA